MSTYVIIIAAAVIIILSFIFNIISNKTNIPSVLMLIILGVIIQLTIWAPNTDAKDSQLMMGLEILGNVGLIFIVLEAALDLKLRREKIGMIFKSFIVAFFALILSSFAIASLFMLLWFEPQSANNVNWITSLMYAVPLSIMSSAIIIPSVSRLMKEKKEFMIYESTFSDILGIMFFYFLKDNRHVESASEIFKEVSFNIGATVLIAVFISYLLVILFQKLKMQAKYFLMFSVLVLLYAIGKMFHISSLVIILFFGLILNNSKLFFIGPLKRFTAGEKLKESLHELHVITLETAFVLRTFFFVVFGITISISSLFDWRYGLISLVIVCVLFIVRLILLRLFSGKDIFPQLWIAPRGLITVLLFFSIPNGWVDIQGDFLDYYNAKFDCTISFFDQGILLHTIILTSLIMTISLIMNRGEKVKDVLIDSIKLKSNQNMMSDKIEEALSNNESHQNQKEE
ncbi:MAG: cation:proton antiporter [Flavobacteriales bacterium]|jgi:NhaP-type Na+/H+ or K+/H+ antiporter|nr:cation:proton antiporter [Flavobacteriales bacterium]